MTYYEELLKGSVVSIRERFPKDSSLLVVACAEVDKLRAALQSAKDEAERARNENVDAIVNGAGGLYLKELRAQLAALSAECEALREDKARLIPADLGAWTSTIRWMLNISEDCPRTRAVTLFDSVTDTKGVPHRAHLEALWSWLDELGGRQSGATGTPTYKIPYEIRNSMEHLQAKLQRTMDRELDRQAKPQIDASKNAGKGA